MRQEAATEAGRGSVRDDVRANRKRGEAEGTIGLAADARIGERVGHADRSRIGRPDRGTEQVATDEGGGVTVLASEGDGVDADPRRASSRQGERAARRCEAERTRGFDDRRAGVTDDGERTTREVERTGRTEIEGTAGDGCRCIGGQGDRRAEDRRDGRTRSDARTGHGHTSKEARRIGDVEGRVGVGITGEADRSTHRGRAEEERTAETVALGDHRAIQDERRPREDVGRRERGTAIAA